jgi:hypothetical protein
MLEQMMTKITMELSDDMIAQWLRDTARLAMNAAIPQAQAEGVWVVNKLDLANVVDSASTLAACNRLLMDMDREPVTRKDFWL